MQLAVPEDASIREQGRQEVRTSPACPGGDVRVLRPRSCLYPVSLISQACPNLRSGPMCPVAQVHRTSSAVSSPRTLTRRRCQVSNISISIKMPDGSAQNMDVDAGQTVEYVRAYIHEHFGVPFAGSTLTFEGRTLIDPMSLCDFGVTVVTLPRHTIPLLAAALWRVVWS